MRTMAKATWIAGGAAVALTLGTATAVAATGGGTDDGPRVVQSGTPAGEDRTPRPTPSDQPSPVPVGPSTPGARGRGADDPATHDVGDDHGADDPATHDAGEHHGLGGHGSDD
jgi:hypothetical protein